MHHQIQVLVDSDAVAREAASFVADRARTAVARSGSFRFAVSGGRTPWAMFAVLTSEDVPWEQVTVYQVDERVAPEGDPDRNLGHLRESLGGVPAHVQPMPVEDSLLDAAAARYEALLPEHFDLVHLGLGPDGHTASLVPGDPVLELQSQLVGLTGPYQGRRRMTLTYPALARAREILWLVTGTDKREPLARLLAGERGIPAGRVEAGASWILADKEAT